MSKLKRKILDVLAWIALAVGIVMILWRIFGDSPTDLAIITPFIVFAILKTWNANNELKDFKTDHGIFKHQVKSSFDKVKENMSRIETKIDNLKPKSRKKK